MRLFILITSILLSTLFNLSMAQTTGLDAYWDDGLKFKSKDDRYKFSVGGRVHYDAAFLQHSTKLDSAFGKARNKTEIRRARLSFEGTINNALAYEFEFTFNEKVEFADMYVAFLRFPFFDRLTIGHFREPFGLEELTSSNQIVFMERSLTSTFGPSRNTGIMVQKSFNKDKWNWYSGMFRITDDLGADTEGNNKYSISNRVVYNPVYDTTVNNTLHIGLGLNHYQPVDNIMLLQSTNESELSPNYINSELENIKNVTQIGGEFGYSNKNLFFQSEYIHAFAKQKKHNEIDLKDFNSFYLMASYFLNGGLRTYNKSGNRFSSISLKKKTNEGSLKGAWEAGFRLSHLNANNSDSFIKNMTDVTLGLSWYYNSNSRLMMNYIHSRMNENLSANSLLFRVQVTF